MEAATPQPGGTQSNGSIEAAAAAAPPGGTQSNGSIEAAAAAPFQSVRSDTVASEVAAPSSGGVTPEREDIVVADDDAGSAGAAGDVDTTGEAGDEAESLCR